jgi:hypothetical protein
MHTGRLRWRFLVLIVLLGAVALPLKKAFVQVTGEAIARSAVQQAVKQLLPSGALVSQQVDVAAKSISVRLFSTKQVSEDKREEAEQMIQHRSGRVTTMTVESVASQSELAQMMKRLSATPVQPRPPIAPPVETIDAIRANLLGRISPAITAVWPPTAPISSFDITLSAQGVRVEAQYKSDRDLGPIALGMIARQLQDKLNLPTLVVEAHRVRVIRRLRPERKMATR